VRALHDDLPLTSEATIKARKAQSLNVWAGALPEKNTEPNEIFQSKTVEGDLRESLKQ
jgi:hypothetical protein